MNLSRRNKFLTLLGLFCIWIACLGLLDHKFLIGNKKFSICHIYSDLPYKKSWEVKAPLSEEIVQQPFFYLGRGHQTYAFVSQDNRYVMKFYRFPSHLRPFGWMNHLFGKTAPQDRRLQSSKIRDEFSELQNRFRKT